MSSRSCLELGVGLGELVGRRPLRRPARRAPAGRRARWRSSSTRRSSPWACDSSLVTFWARSGRPTGAGRTPRVRASRCGRAARRHRAPSPPWSGWSRGRRCRLDGQDPREFSVTGASVPFSIGAGNQPGYDATAPCAWPGERQISLSEGSHAPIPCGDRRLRPLGLFCRGLAAEVRRRRPTTPTCASTCWRCCRRRGAWCAPASPRTIRRSSRSARSSRRRRWIRGSGSSATSWSATTCRPAELAERYDAVIYAVGAQSDRSLGIPGEDLPGSVPAVDFVGWYNAHPHFEEMAPDISSGRAVVVGNGNVALDVARILVTDPDVLAATDIADHALKSLHDRGVEEVLDHRQARTAAGTVHHAGAARARRPRGSRRRRRDRRPGRLRRHLRRGPGGRGQDRAQQHQGAARLRRTRRRGAPSGGSCSGSAPRPIEIKGDGKVESIVLGRNELVDDNGRIAAKDTGEREEVPAQLVVRAVGYRGVPDAGPAVRRAQRHHPAHRRPDRGQPQRVRGRLDQARAHRA